MEKEKYSMSFDNLPGIGYSIKYLNREDSERVIDVFNRVRGCEFNHTDVSDVFSRSMMRKLLEIGVLVKSSRKTRHKPTGWRFKDDIARKIEMAVSS